MYNYPSNDENSKIVVSQSISSRVKRIKRNRFNDNTKFDIKNASPELSTSPLLIAINAVKPRVLEILNAKDVDMYVNDTYRSRFFADPDKRDRLICCYGLTKELGPVRVSNYTSIKHSKGSLRTSFGIHLYETKGKDPISYVSVSIPATHGGTEDILFVEKGKSFRLHRQWARQIAYSSKIDKPVLPGNMLEEIEKNTVRFLQSAKQFKSYNTVARRGIVLSGSPGNGKTMVCRYIRKLCDKFNIEYNIVSASDIESSYSKGHLSSVMNQEGVTFFDDIDISIFSRKNGGNTKMACAMLAAMDGMDNECNSIRIFTTNEMLQDMDDAFKRPGRIDKLFEFENPDEKMRKKLLDTWPEEIISSMDVCQAAKQTDGLSFAELNGIKSIMVTEHIIENNEFDFGKAHKIMIDSIEDKKSGKSMGKGRAGFGGGG